MDRVTLAPKAYNIGRGPVAGGLGRGQPTNGHRTWITPPIGQRVCACNLPAWALHPLGKRGTNIEWKWSCAHMLQTSHALCPEQHALHPRRCPWMIQAWTKPSLKELCLCASRSRRSRSSQQLSAAPQQRLSSASAAPQQLFRAAPAPPRPAPPRARPRPARADAKVDARVDAKRYLGGIASGC